jgi:sulfotransferase
MDRGIHFISGLPRAGSTLLAAILRQNPKYHAGMTSPVGGLFNHVHNGMGANQEFSLFIDGEQRKDILRALFEGYYRKVHTEKLVFDTNRLWCSRMAHIAALFPKAKVIACVRDPAWIVDSFERLVQKNALIVSKIYPGDANTTVFTRVDHVTSKTGTAGFAWNAVQEAFYGEFASRLILVDYEALTREPKRTMDRLYAFLDLPGFEHDFENVVYDDASEFDEQLGVPGLHAVTRKVRFSERKTILPPEIFQRFANQCFWRNPEANPNNVPVLSPGGQHPRA